MNVSGSNRNVKGLMRFGVAVLASGVVTLGLFFFMQQLIASGDAFADASDEFVGAEFIRFKRDEVTRTKQRELPPEPPPPKKPPPPPDLAVDPIDQTSAPAPQMQFPKINVALGSPGGGPFLSGYLTDGGVTGDQEVLPLVQVAPDWPRRALVEGIEGWVTMDLNLRADGTVERAIVIESSNSMFEISARKGILKWKFRPKVVAGEPVSTTIRYTLEFTFNESQ